MGDIHIELDEGTDLEFDSIDIGTSEEVIAFDLSGRIIGLDEKTLSQLVGEQVVPTEIILKPQTDTCRDCE